MAFFINLCCRIDARGRADRGAWRESWDHAGKAGEHHRHAGG